MGLENRDWYREEPSAAWKEWRAGDGGPPTTRAPREPPSLLRRVLVGVVVMLAAVLVAIFVLARIAIPEVDRTPIVNPRAAATAFDLGWNPALHVRVSHATRWTLRDPRFGVSGTLVVTVPAGAYPRDALSDALTARGFEVTLPWMPPKEHDPETGSRS